ncbi:MAG: hypothetical protein ABSA75_03835 [Candidatus Bathyarchaeia archaeon]|jgi:DhnA family fructose-bisphosphate aldolase class Ia
MIKTPAFFQPNLVPFPKIDESFFESRRAVISHLGGDSSLSVVEMDHGLNKNKHMLFVVLSLVETLIMDLIDMASTTHGVAASFSDTLS